MTAGTGMIAQQHNLDVIANNLANVNTAGFKQQRAEFQDLMYQTVRGAGLSADGAPTATENLQIGMGAKIAATASNFKDGSLEETGNPLNMAITGNGFFKLKGADGNPVYTRDGTFKLNGDGKIVNSSGLFLDTDVQVPEGATAISVSETGEVSAIKPGETNSSSLGKIQLTAFPNPGGMMRLGNSLFGATDGSGAPVEGAPNANGMGQLSSSRIEGSNVEVVEEMTRMITAQRAYEINSKAIQTADDMLGIVNNLKR